jgi:uncharacterized phiE125 gp8 family phage protein
LPVTLAEAKSHLRILHTEDDAQITNLIAAAVDEFEQRTGRAFSAITAQLRLSEFPDESIAIPRPPLQAVSSVTYTTAAGVVTMPGGDYLVDSTHSPGLITPTNGWPAAIDRPGSIVVSFTAGNPAGCSARIKNALLLWLDLHYHEQKEDTARRIQSRIDGILSDRSIHHPDLAGLTVQD